MLKINTQHAQIKCNKCTNYNNLKTIITDHCGLLKLTANFEMYAFEEPISLDDNRGFLVFSLEIFLFAQQIKQGRRKRHAYRQLH